MLKPVVFSQHTQPLHGGPQCHWQPFLGLATQCCPAVADFGTAADGLCRCPAAGTAVRSLDCGTALAVASLSGPRFRSAWS